MGKNYTYLQTQEMAVLAAACSADIAYEISNAMRQGRRVCDCLWTKLKYVTRAKRILDAYIPPDATAYDQGPELITSGGNTYAPGTRAFAAIFVDVADVTQAVTNVTVTHSVDGVLFTNAGPYLNVAAAMTAIQAAFGTTRLWNYEVGNQIVWTFGPADEIYKDTTFTLALTSQAVNYSFVVTFVGGPYQRTAAMNCLTNDQITKINENVQQICGCNCADSTNDDVS